ncbi:MAG TPA: hypothetical protein VIL97_00855 [Thermoanaerobaculia bacterium]
MIAVVGSVEGAFESRFRTALTLYNPYSFALRGKLQFRPAGQVDVTAGSLDYEVAPGASVAYDDVVASMGAIGLGSLDVVPGAGTATLSEFTVPFLDARIISERSSMGQLATAVPEIRPIDARGGIATVLFVNEDPSIARMSIGVRTLDEPVILEYEVFAKDGTRKILRTPRAYDRELFEQLPAEAFTGVSLAKGDVIQIRTHRFTLGGVIVYGVTTDNQTNAPMLQMKDAAAAQRTVGLERLK